MLRSIIKPQLLSRGLHTTRPALAFKKVIEEDIRYLIDSLPPPSKLYQNADGTPREPTDLELHKLAHLSVLNDSRRFTLWDYLTVTEDNAKLYSDNYTDIKNLLPSSENGASGNIVDKIPYEDENGKVQWKIVREVEREGWESPVMYGLVPLCLIFLGINLFSDETAGVNQWADEELRLRVMEDVKGGDTDAAKKSLNDFDKTPSQIKKRDELIIERILSGDYDKLAGLKKKQNLSLVGDLTESSD